MSPGPDGGGPPPVALTIAGSDSGAGAGLQADLKAMSALGVFATTVVTAVTAQNTAEVTAVHPVPTDVVAAQLDAVLTDFDVVAVKTGMLGPLDTVRLVAGRAADGDLPSLVVDPVMVTSSGRRILDDEGVSAYRELLLPHSLIVTPNLFEAAVLSGIELPVRPDVDTMTDLAERIHRLGPRWVLVKGGHLPGVHDGRSSGPDQVVDVLLGPSGSTVLAADRVATRNNHGTGCSTASAITALLARGSDVPDAVAGAKRFVHDALTGATGWRLGKGRGPLDPFGWSFDRPTGAAEAGS